jgi:hypothetical protein
MAFKLLPANGIAYARFLMGNKITKMLGTEVASENDLNLTLLQEDAKDVLRTAVASARSKGRNYVQYDDYPAMKSGERPDQFWKGKRDSRSFWDLYVESATDPVLEMFTSVGGFKFKDLPNGGFEIPNDPYNFDRSKSGARKNPKDDYSKAVYDAQDIDQTYKFSLSGVIPPKGGTTIDTEYVGKLARAAYDTASDVVMESAKLVQDNLPYEFMAIMREGLDRFTSSSPSDLIDLAEVDFPDMGALPDFIEDMQAKVTETGYELASKYADGLKLDMNIPRLDISYGDIFDAEVDMSSMSPRLPAGLLSDDRLQQAKDAVQQVFSAMPAKTDPENLTFGQAFARNRAAGADVFEWRGDKYTTQTAEEADE